MKKIITLMLITMTFIFGHDALAQVSIDSIKISPQNPVKNDNIRIFLYTSTYHVSTRIFLTHQLNGNTYSIEGCYTMQGSPAATFYADTINVGPLIDGTYKIHFTCYRSLDDNQCDYLDTAQDSLTFTILPPISVPAISNIPAIHPNPASNLLHIKNSSIKEAVIYIHKA